MWRKLQKQLRRQRKGKAQQRQPLEKRSPRKKLPEKAHPMLKAHRMKQRHQRIKNEQMTAGLSAVFSKQKVDQGVERFQKIPDKPVAVHAFFAAVDDGGAFQKLFGKPVKIIGLLLG